MQGWLTMKMMADGVMEQVAADGNEMTGPNVKAALESMSNFDTGGITESLTFCSSDLPGTKPCNSFKLKTVKWNPLAITSQYPKSNCNRTNGSISKGSSTNLYRLTIRENYVISQ